ncbi:hypothetical protein QL285_034305 [Trifolium repens]|nr:hypothetical protein QL285_034305 [Trifolium repens]
MELIEGSAIFISKTLSWANIFLDLGTVTENCRRQSSPLRVAARFTFERAGKYELMEGLSRKKEQYA